MERFNIFCPGSDTFRTVQSYDGLDIGTHVHWYFGTLESDVIRKLQFKRNSTDVALQITVYFNSHDIAGNVSKSTEIRPRTEVTSPNNLAGKKIISVSPHHRYGPVPKMDDYRPSRITQKWMILA